MTSRHDLAVTVAGLEHEFPTRGGAVHALDRLDLTIEPGELLTLAGPSGCGKSTALRMIAGLEDPTSGTITIGERVVTRRVGQPRGGVEAVHDGVYANVA